MLLFYALLKVFAYLCGIILLFYALLKVFAYLCGIIFAEKYM